MEAKAIIYCETPKLSIKWFNSADLGNKTDVVEIASRTEFMFESSEERQLNLSVQNTMNIDN